MTSANGTATAPLLRLEELKIHFGTRGGDVKAVDGVDLDIRPGEIVGLVGESGSGKSVTARSIMRLVPMPPGKLVGGRILFHGQDLLDLPNRQMQDLRGGRIAMIFQDPMTFLNPLYTAGEQVAEAIRRHQGLDRRAARAAVVDLFRTVGIPNAEHRYDAYPHQLSGGLRQRVMIAMALSSKPDLLIADEPTTALDVTIQAQILGLMRDLQERIGTSIILITHDLGVVASVADRVAVMYSGKVVETGTVREIFYQPKMPYTWGLLASIPLLTADSSLELIPIPGSPPDALDPPKGCPFTVRCPYAMKICSEEMPAYTSFSTEHQAACWLHHDMAPKVEPPARIGSSR